MSNKNKWTADARSDSRREERARRFARNEDATHSARQKEMRRKLEQASSSIESPEVIVGTSTEIEKPFFRLTTVIISLLYGCSIDH